MRSRFIAGLVDGTKTSARCPSLVATWATAAPWLPPEAATNPAGGTSARRTRWNAPRGLNEPVCWSSSSLSVTGVARPSSPAAISTTGVVRTYVPIRAAAASTSAGVTRVNVLDESRQQLATKSRMCRGPSGAGTHRFAVSPPCGSPGECRRTRVRACGLGSGRSKGCPGPERCRQRSGSPEPTARLLGDDRLQVVSTLRRDVPSPTAHRPAARSDGWCRRAVGRDWARSCTDP